MLDQPVRTNVLVEVVLVYEGQDLPLAQSLQTLAEPAPIAGALLLETVLDVDGGGQELVDGQL